jgi:hypothetical protein
MYLAMEPDHRAALTGRPALECGKRGVRTVFWEPREKEEKL